MKALRVSRLEKRSNLLLSTLRKTGLGRGLQDARRDVARAVELMRHPGRQRGPERDYGPSR